VARHRPRIVALVASRLAARLAMGVDHDDVYQETILRALDASGKLEWRGPDSFLRWIGGIVDNVILELARRRARERKVELQGDWPAEDATPSRAALREERFERLKASLAGLSADHRQVVLLTRIRGLSFEEAARAMSRTPDAVKQLLYRALRELKERFGDTESLHLPACRLDASPDVEDGEGKP
jgi:RNA polymerase sigma-70 factor (ECF subfamily)